MDMLKRHLETTLQLGGDNLHLNLCLAAKVVNGPQQEIRLGVIRLSRPNARFVSASAAWRECKPVSFSCNCGGKSAIIGSAQVLRCMYGL